MTSTHSRKATETDRAWQIKSIVIALIIVAGIIVAIFASEWFGDLSEERRNDRLEEVLEECNGRENSSKCKKLQEKYNMTFRYCRTISDTDRIKTYYTPDGMFHIEMPPKTPVVWEGNSQQPPKDSLGFSSFYHDCTEHDD